MLGALQKMPPWRGVLYRGATMTPEVLRTYTAAASTGTTLREPGFVSATPDDSVRFDANALLVIDSRTGRDISVVSHEPRWREIVIPAPGDFEVIAVDTARPEESVVFMREVADDDVSEDRGAILTTLRAAVDARNRRDAARDVPAEFVARLTGAIGVDDSGRPFSRPPSIDELIESAREDDRQREPLRRALREIELFAVLATRDRPVLVPSDVAGRRVLRLFTSRERVVGEMQNQRPFTRAPARSLVSAAGDLAVLVVPRHGDAIELSPEDIAALTAP